MKKQNLKGIITRFKYALAYCFILGILMGLASKLSYPQLDSLIKAIIAENSAPKSFHLIAVMSIICLGIFIILFGRTKDEISCFRYSICYQPAEVALNLAAVFYGLIFGFYLIIWRWSLFFIGFLSFLSTAGILIILLYFSFDRDENQNEMQARLFSLVLVIVSIVVFWLEHFY